VRINESQENIVALSDIRKEKLRASSHYGPVRAGLTTSPRTDTEARLTELLNSLESVVETLQYKSFTVYDTLIVAIEGVRVALSHTTDEAGTEEDML